MCSPHLSTQKPTWEGCQYSLLSTFVGRIQTGCEQTERFFSHLYSSKTPCCREFCKNRHDLINSGKRHMPTETLFCQHKLCCHQRSISNPTLVSVGTPLHWLGAVRVDSAGGSQPVRSVLRWAPAPSSQEEVVAISAAPVSTENLWKLEVSSGMCSWLVLKSRWESCLLCSMWSPQIWWYLRSFWCLLWDLDNQLRGLPLQPCVQLGCLVLRSGECH